MSDSRVLTKKDMVLLGVFFLCALAIRLYFLQFLKVISADGVGYVTTARALVNGDSLGGMTVYGAIYPPLVAGAGLVVGDMELGGRLVSVFMGSLLVVPLYLVSMELFNKKVGALACVLVLAWPSLRSWSCEVMTQATYITLMLSGLYLTCVALRERSLKFSFAGGVLLALSYLTRPEALITFAALAGALLVGARLTGVAWKPACLLVLAGCLGFAIPLLPYIFLIHNITGKWQLAGKTASTLADALSEYLGRPDMKNEAGFQGIGVAEVIRRYPDFLWSNFQKNLTKTVQTMLPLYCWALAALGCLSYGWSREKIAQQALLLATFAPLLVIMIFFFVGPEYLQPYLPVLFLWVAAGLLWLEGTLLRLTALDTSPKWSKVGSLMPVSACLAFWIALSLLVSQIPANANEPYHYSQDGGRYDQKRIGLMLKNILPPHSKIMTRWGRISFYAEMEQVMIPQASLQEVLQSAAKGKVRYLVVDGMLAGMRPQLEVLFGPLFSGEERVEYLEKGAGYRPVPGLRLLYLHKDPSSIGLAVYEIVS
jgi:4-amino-4-deoxy-L-arabinose transferase-like glycosyltransferase